MKPPCSRTCTYRKRTAHGYWAVRRPDHDRADPKGWVLEHILIAELMYGGPLLPGAVVHHLDGNRANNAPRNLCILFDQAEHNRVHGLERRRSDAQVEMWPGIEYAWWAARCPWLPQIAPS